MFNRFRNLSEELPDSQSESSAELRDYAFGTPERLLGIREKIERQNLPVLERRVDLSDAIERNLETAEPLLLQGEPGSGKSLITPVVLLEVLEKQRRIPKVMVMEPRRDAASMVAEGVAAITGKSFGDEVGFSTSENKQIGPHTKIGTMTSGIFLRRLIEGNFTKEKVGALVVDELHEGSLEYHLVLGLLKLAKQKGELPFLMLMSATLDTEKVNKFLDLNSEHNLKIEGRSHPVEVEYAKETKAEYGKQDKLAYIDQAVEVAVKEYKQTQTGDMLIFMPGEFEIQKTISALKQSHAFNDSVEILSLSGALSPEQRFYTLSDKKPENIQRRIIVSTNIAESSVTVPGVTVVVDSCRKRVVVYDPETQINRTVTELISQDEAKQRAGRAGRVQAGKAIRLVTEEEYKKMPEHPTSEINRVNLAQAYLRIKSLGIDPEHFPFIDPPQEGALKAAKRELIGLSLLTANGKLNELGERVSEMPFEPRVGKMLLEAEQRGIPQEGLLLAALTREKSILLGPTKQDEERYGGKIYARARIANLQKQFEASGSDWHKMLNVFLAAMNEGVFTVSQNIHNSNYQQIKNSFRDWCKEHYLNDRALTHIAYKVLEYSKHTGIEVEGWSLAEGLRNLDNRKLTEVLFSGFSDKLMYLFGRGYGMVGEGEQLDDIEVSPASVNFQDRPRMCVAESVTEGSGGSSGQKRFYAHMLHPITLQDVQRVRPDLISEEKESTSIFLDRRGTIYEYYGLYLKYKKQKIYLEQEARERKNLSPEEKAYVERIAEINRRIQAAKLELASIREKKQLFDIPFYSDLGLSRVEGVFSRGTVDIFGKDVSPDQHLTTAERALTLVENGIAEQQESLKELEELYDESLKLEKQVGALWQEKFHGISYKVYDLSKKDFEDMESRLQLARKVLRLLPPKSVKLEDGSVAYDVTSGPDINPELAHRLLKKLVEELSILESGVVRVSEQEIGLVESKRKELNKACEQGWTTETQSLLAEKIGFMTATALNYLSTTEKKDPERSKIQGFVNSFNDLEQETNRQLDRPIVILGKLNNQEGALQRLVSARGRKQSSGFDEDWKIKYESAWLSCSNVVDSDELASEYINAGFVNRDAVIKKLREFCESNLNRYILGDSKDIDLTRQVENILETLV